MKTGKEKIDWVNEQINNGATVVIATMTKAWNVSAKDVKRFKKAGYDLFKVGSDGSAYMRFGKRWDCIDGCAFKAFK